VEVVSIHDLLSCILRPRPILVEYSRGREDAQVMVGRLRGREGERVEQSRVV
jgi:hypothetical protein